MVYVNLYYYEVSTLHNKRRKMTKILITAVRYEQNTRNCSVLPCSVIEISSGLPLLIVGGRFVFLLYFILSLISRKVQIIVSKMYKNKGVKGTRDQNLIAESEGIGTTSFF